MTPGHEASKEANEAVSFAHLTIDPKILAVLEKNGFVTPTPIQAKVIPMGISGKDIIGIAQTGTGKTLGFGVPIIERVLKEGALALILLPTRELALQVNEAFQKVGGPLGIKTAVLIGGEPMGRQLRALRARPDVVIATPGRLIDHLEQKTMKLDFVTIVVLDEADHMFDIGFMPQIKEIMKKVPKERQTMLFSATMPEAIAKLAMEHMQIPLRIEVAPPGTSAASVDQEIIIVDRKAKFSLLANIVGENKGVPIIVFSRTKHGARHIVEDLRNAGITAAEIHSDRSLSQRREALDGFKMHKYQVLVATDIAARGIDVKDIGVVVNYDLPEQSEDYVHRIGRTGRAGKAGKAISFATPDQKRDIMDIERLIKKPIPVKSHGGAKISESRFEPRPRRGGFSRGGFAGRPRMGAARSHGPRRGGFASKFPRPLKTDPSKTTSLGGGYRRVFRKGVR